MTRRRRLGAATLGRLPVPARRGVALLLVALLLPVAAVAGGLMLLADRLPAAGRWLVGSPAAAGRWCRALGVDVWRVAVSVSDRWAPRHPLDAPSDPLPDDRAPQVYSPTPRAPGAAEAAPVPVRSWADCRCGVCRPAGCSCPCHSGVPAR